jgi:hypothetical protein
MASPLPPATSFAIRLDGSSGPEERRFIDIYRCRRCQHDWDQHGTAGAVLPSKSKCQLAGCDCHRFAQEGDL